MLKKNERFPGGKMTWRGISRFWVGDGGCPGGRMNSCGSYGGDYSSRKSNVECKQ